MLTCTYPVPGAYPYEGGRPILKGKESKNIGSGVLGDFLVVFLRSEKVGYCSELYSQLCEIRAQQTNGEESKRRDRESCQ